MVKRPGYEQICHLSYAAGGGGAGRAAWRIHRALLDVGVESRMRVVEKLVDDWRVTSPQGGAARLGGIVRGQVGRAVGRLQRLPQGMPCTPAVVPSGLPGEMNAAGADLLHLHWVGRGMLSLGDLARFRAPMVWTLHDMWAFCGAEHYTESDRWRRGYDAGDRPPEAGGLDIDRWTWRRKRRLWTRPLTLVTPTRWLGDCVRESALLADWPVEVISNPLDVAFWRPLPQTLARELLDLPRDVPLLLFGAVGGTADPRKGFDLLQEALAHLRDAGAEVELVVFGQGPPREPLDLPFRTHFVGRLQDESSLRLLYSAADAFVLPSRQDNQPLTGLEAQACGTPVVAFDCCGLPDVVAHRERGWLARPFDSEDLARGIRWVLDENRTDSGVSVATGQGSPSSVMNYERAGRLSAAARDWAVTHLAYPVVAERYRDLYRRVLDGA